jgi:hypothetical protein
VAQQPTFGLGRLTVEVARSHTIRHTQTPGSTSLIKRSPHRSGRYLQKTQKTQEMNIHALGGIQTCDPSNQAPADLLLRPLGHRDRQRLIKHKNNAFSKPGYTFDGFVLFTNRLTAEDPQSSGPRHSSKWIYTLNSLTELYICID